MFACAKQGAVESIKATITRNAYMAFPVWLPVHPDCARHRLIERVLCPQMARRRPLTIRVQTRSHRHCNNLRQRRGKEKPKMQADLP
jgi:hypothetical protein